MRCRRRSDPRDRAGLRDDEGAVTVEAAMALGTLVLVTAAAVAAVAAVAAAVRCTDAARELALQAARGDADRGRAAVAALAPGGAESDLRIDGDTVVVTVRSRPVGLLPISVGGTATAITEPGLSATGAAGPGTPAGAPPGTDPPAGADPTDGDDPTEDVATEGVATGGAIIGGDATGHEGSGDEGAEPAG